MSDTITHRDVRLLLQVSSQTVDHWINEGLLSYDFNHDRIHLEGLLDALAGNRLPGLDVRKEYEEMYAAAKRASLDEETLAQAIRDYYEDP